MRYGLQDSQSCLLIADLERLDRAPFLEEMSRLTKGQHVEFLVAHFGHIIPFLPFAITPVGSVFQGIPAICMRAGARIPPQKAQRFEELVILGRSLQPIPRRPVDQDAAWVR